MTGAQLKAPLPTLAGSEIRQLLRERFADVIIADEAARDMDTVVLKKTALVDVATFLRDDPRLAMQMLTDLTAIDWYRQRSPRFDLVALFWSVNAQHRIRVKCPVEESDPEFPTLSGVYPVANWLEREIFDMYGLRAHGHPNLRRILTHEEFEGYPLRKEYPVNRRQPVRPPVEDLLTPKPWPPRGPAEHS